MAEGDAGPGVGPAALVVRSAVGNGVRHGANQPVQVPRYARGVQQTRNAAHGLAFNHQS